MCDFEVTAHTADLKIRVHGRTLDELFSHAIVGMFQSIKPQTRQAGCSYEHGRLICKTLPIIRCVSICAIDRESLLVDFLSKMICLSDIHNEAYLAAEVSVHNDTQLEATVHGVPIIGFEVVEIKAVTYAHIAIRQEDGVWSTDIVFDI